MTTPTRTSRFVQIARPHPFIVREMRAVLERGGWTPLLPEALGTTPANAIDAAVISMALISSVNEPYPEVFRRVRADAPTRPVVFATLMAAEQGRRALQRELSTLPDIPRIITMDAVPASISRRDVLLVTKDDIDEGHADRFLSVLRQIVSARR